MAQTKYLNPAARHSFNFMTIANLACCGWMLIFALIWGAALWWLFVMSLFSLIVVMGIAEYSGAYKQVHIPDEES